MLYFHATCCLRGLANMPLFDYASIADGAALCASLPRQPRYVAAVCAARCQPRHAPCFDLMSMLRIDYFATLPLPLPRHFVRLSPPMLP